MTQIFCSELSRRKYVVRSCRDANVLFGVVVTQMCCSELSFGRPNMLLFGVVGGVDANMLFGGVATQICCSEVS